MLTWEKPSESSWFLHKYQPTQVDPERPDSFKEPRGQANISPVARPLDV